MDERLVFLGKLAECADGLSEKKRGYFSSFASLICIETAGQGKLVDVAFKSPGLKGIKTSSAVEVNEDNLQYTTELYCNVLSICEGWGKCTEMVSAPLKGLFEKVVGSVELVDFNTLYSIVYRGVYGEDAIEVESSLEKTDYDGVEISEEELEESDLELLDDDDDIVSNSDEDDEFEEEEEKEEEKVEDISKELEDAINYFVKDLVPSYVSTLLDRYSDLFKSAYDVNKPLGLLTRDGVVSLSGSQRVVKIANTFKISNIYGILSSKVDFTEFSSRGRGSVAQDIVNTYESTNGRTLCYFPNRLLEYAYGRKPTSGNADSANTYNPHDKGGSWFEYSKVLSTSLSDLFKTFLVEYFKRLTNKGINPKNNEAEVLKFMDYVRDSLSLCFMYVRYREDKDGNPVILSIRYCDSSSEGLLLQSKDYLVREILNQAYRGSIGSDSNSHPAEIVGKSGCVVEITHEFNRTLNQSTPLFAYKALTSLQNDGKALSWDNVILGQDSLGNTMGSEAIPLTKNMFHNIGAGTRAGKGVMTLNLLASALASKKAIFYLDNKPDMASILKLMSPNMFVLNGAAEGADISGQMDPESLMKFVTMPSDAKAALGSLGYWSSGLGDYIYLRAIMFVMGLITARASFSTKEARQSDEFNKLGGEDGLFVVFDEYKAFQDNLNKLLKELLSKVPPLRKVLYNAIKDSAPKSDGKEPKLSKEDFKVVFNDGSYYALSVLNSFAKSLYYLENMIKVKSFSPLEVGSTDIFTLFQEPRGCVDNSVITAMNSDFMDFRYATMQSGIKSGSLILGNDASPALNLINFREQDSDAFIGRNEAGWLGTDDSSSKAYKRLDMVARNFAYLPDYKLKDFCNNDKLREQIAWANKSSTKIFKPFLILNDSAMNSSYVSEMFDSCETNAGLTPQEIIFDNQDPSDANILHRATGLKHYVEMSGISNFEEILEKGARVADYIVKEKIGYPGNWMEFLCDLSPEWIFTVEDIELAIKPRKGARSGFFTPITERSYLSEYYYFNPNRFGGTVEDRKLEEDPFGKLCGADPSCSEDFSDVETTKKESDAKILAEMGIVKDSKELFEESNGSFLNIGDDSVEDSMGEAIEKGSADKAPETDTLQVLQELLRLAQEQSIEKENQNIQLDAGAVNSLMSVLNNLNSDGSLNEPKEYQSTENTIFGDEMRQVQFNSSTEIYEDLSTVITRDVIRKFGGAENIKTFRVLNDGLTINGYNYTARVSESVLNIVPMDVRSLINSGQVSELIDYRFILHCKNLRSIEFGSVDFAYDCFNKFDWYGRGMNIGRLFADLPSLDALKVGSHIFTRKNYQEEAEKSDIFYASSKAEKVSNYIGGLVNNGRDRSWAMAKRNWKQLWSSSKSTTLGGKFGNLVGIVTGSAIAATTGVAGLGGKVGKAGTSKVSSLVRKFKNGAKDLF